MVFESSLMQNFKILESIGVGATSEVFKAKNLTNNKFVALKVFPAFISRDEDAVKRLNREAEILKHLNHQNIVQLYSYTLEQDKFFLELEFVEGGHLKKWIASYNIKLLEPRLWILVQIARGIGNAHEKGILHRDLKPENIIVSNKGVVKVADFGLAKSVSQITMSRVGSIIGSLGYMAPEVIEGEKSDIQADIFSFGAIAYEMLANKAPFEAETPQGVIRNIAEQKLFP